MDESLVNILKIIIASGLVLVLPGYVWFAWLSDQGEDLPGRLAQIVGVSLSLNAILAGAAFLFGFHAGSIALYGIYATLLVLASLSIGLTLRKLHFRRHLERRQSEEEVAQLDPKNTWWRSPAALAVAILAGFGFLLAWRFYQVRDLALPAWVDPLHHVLIVRLILENGGLPATFDPYMPVPFYYHFGFHVNAALFSFWSGLHPEKAVLALGQILNAAVALSVYRLGMSLWSDWRRASVAGLLVGFVSQMPAYYVTWGRYTLVTGLVLLPLALAVTVDLLRLGWDRERVARLAILTAGLILTHYIAALLFAVLAFIGLLYLIISPRYLEGGGKRAGAISGVIGALAAGFLLTLPWLLRVWEFAGSYTTVSTVPLDAPIDTIYFSGYLSYLWYLLGPDRNYFLLILACIGLVAGGWRHRSLLLVIWALALLLLSSPWGPRLNPLRPDHVVIVLFIPVSLMVADGLFLICDRLRERGLGRWADFMIGLIVVLLLVWGLSETRTITNPVTLIADQADVSAIEWIAENTPEEARVFINTAHWQNGVYRGVDGGWWILPLTGRQTLLPPTMYLLGDRDYVLRLNSWGDRASRLHECDGEMWKLLEETASTFVYVKDGAGSLQAGRLRSCPGMEEVYARDGVHIFELTSPSGQIHNSALRPDFRL